MIEIEFRGQVPDGDWVYGDLYRYPMLVWDKTVKQGTMITDYFRNGDPVKPETVSQFTGYKDRNGKKIYDGDIIREKLLDSVQPDGYYYWNAEVKQVNGCWVLMQIAFDYSNTKFEDFTLLYKEANNIEVVGNIFEQ